MRDNPEGGEFDQTCAEEAQMRDNPEGGELDQTSPSVLSSIDITESLLNLNKCESSLTAKSILLFNNISRLILLKVFVQYDSKIKSSVSSLSKIRFSKMPIYYQCHTYRK